MSQAAQSVRPAESSGRRALSGDAGFALVEVMVSAVLLIILALATLPVIDQAANRAGTNRSQGVASSLAQGDQQRMRQMASTVLANYRRTQNTTVKGIAYNVQSRADVVRDTSGIVACQTDNGRAEYFKISSTVTWPQMNGVNPVVVESIIAPGVAALGLSTVTVKLTNASGGPQPNVPVTAGTLSDSTDAGGCAVFAFVNPGTINVSWSKSGYVDHKGNPAPVQAVSATATATANVGDEYDRAATVPVALRDQNDIAAQWPSVSGKTGGPGFGTPRTWTVTPATASSFNADKLFPYPSNAYAFYAGACTGNDPAKYVSAYTSPSVLTSPGQTTAALTVPLRAVSVHTQNVSSSTNQPNYNAARVVVKPDTSVPEMAVGGCETVTTPVNANGDATVYLPWGRWIVCAERTTQARHRNITLTTPAAHGTYNNVPSNGPPANLTPDTAAGPFVLNLNGTPNAAPTGAC